MSILPSPPRLQTIKWRSPSHYRRARLLVWILNEGLTSKSILYLMGCIQWARDNGHNGFCGNLRACDWRIQTRYNRGCVECYINQSAFQGPGPILLQAQLCSLLCLQADFVVSKVMTKFGAVYVWALKSSEAVNGYSAGFMVTNVFF